MQSRTSSRCYLTLKNSDYANGKYTINLPRTLENVNSVVIHSATISTLNDSDVLYLKSEAISKNKKEKVASDNDGNTHIVYNIFGNNRLSKNFTSPGNSLLNTVLQHQANGWIGLWLDFDVSGNVLNYNDVQASIGNHVKEFKGRYPGGNTLRFFT